MTLLAVMPLLIRLLVPTGQSPDGLNLDAVAAEVQHLWTPRVTVRVEIATGHEPACETTVWLRFQDQLGPDAHAEALAWTPFTAGVPGAVITVSPRRIREAVTRRAPGPADAEPDLLARATGRVIAHELGHVLFGEPGHTREGLMQTGFSADDLTSVQAAHLTLPAWPLRAGPAPARVRQ